MATMTHLMIRHKGHPVVTCWLDTSSGSSPSISSRAVRLNRAWKATDAVYVYHACVHLYISVCLSVRVYLFIYACVCLYMQVC